MFSTCLTRGPPRNRACRIDAILGTHLPWILRIRRTNNLPFLTFEAGRPKNSLSSIFSTGRTTKPLPSVSSDLLLSTNPHQVLSPFGHASVLFVAGDFLQHGSFPRLPSDVLPLTLTRFSSMSYYAQGEPLVWRYLSNAGFLQK